MAAAYRYGNPDRPLNVVILSDGLTEPSDQPELLNLIRSRPSNARVFCIGVGNDVNRPLLSQLAQQAGGLAAFLSREDDFGRQAKAFRRKLLHPAASKVRITLQGPDAYDVEPRQLPNLYHGMPLRMYGRYRTAGPAKVRVQAEINGAAFDQTVDVNLPAREGNPEIERMWARRRSIVHRRGRIRRSRRVDEIVRFGEGYSIVTEYTSFIALENDGEYQRWKIDRRNLLRLARPPAATDAPGGTGACPRTGNGPSRTQDRCRSPRVRRHAGCQFPGRADATGSHCEPVGSAQPRFSADRPFGRGLARRWGVRSAHGLNLCWRWPALGYAAQRRERHRRADRKRDRR